VTDRSEDQQSGTPEIARETVTLNGQHIRYRVAGPDRPDVPVVLLVHGIAGRAAQWDGTIAPLARRCRVIAPDLLGHGHSAKPRGDYSLGAYSVGLRDLLLALGHERATIVGHSLGGGVAMQFAYGYPMLTERLVLVSSGGLGREVHGLLKAVTWPGAEWVLPMIAGPRSQAVGSTVRKLLAGTGVTPGPDVAEMLRSFGSLTDPAARRAFILTIRSVIDARGQRVSASDRLHLADLIPTLIIWGRRDPIIPASHGEWAHEQMPGSRLEILEGVGHFPQLECPDRVAELLIDFVSSTAPAEIEFAGEQLQRLRSRMMGTVDR
jgi:pimeloyl-ACP methyl ester carboxylesterase